MKVNFWFRYFMMKHHKIIFRSRNFCYCINTFLFWYSNWVKLHPILQFLLINELPIYVFDLINGVSAVVLEHAELPLTPLIVFILPDVEIAIIFPSLSLSVPEPVLIELAWVVLKAWNIGFVTPAICSFRILWQEVSEIVVLSARNSISIDHPGKRPSIAVPSNECKGSLL